MRVAYTVEQCWHRVPGGTAVSATRIAGAMASIDDVTLLAVAGRHRALPPDPWPPRVAVAHLPIAAPWLYETWLRWDWPKVERALGPVDVAHATTIIPCASDAPLVVTIHDLAFVHRPEHFTKHGVRVFDRSLAVIRRRAVRVLCSSEATMDDCLAAGIGGDRLRHVPLGVDAGVATDADVARVVADHALPERFALFVGTLEPRKNLRTLAAAVALLDDPLPLVVAGAAGWGDATEGVAGDVRFVGFVAEEDLAALYAAATVFCYPSLHEGYGLPVLEAMVQGTPVVTSRGTSTEEAAGGAAVLVDPASKVDIARGITEAIAGREALARAGRARATTQTWQRTAQLTADVYREVAA